MKLDSLIFKRIKDVPELRAIPYPVIEEIVSEAVEQIEILHMEKGELSMDQLLSEDWYLCEGCRNTVHIELEGVMDAEDTVVFCSDCAKKDHATQ